MYIYIHEDDNKQPYEDHVVYSYYYETYDEAFKNAQKCIGAPQDEFDIWSDPHEHRIVKVELGTQVRKLLSKYEPCKGWSHTGLLDEVVNKDKL